MCHPHGRRRDCSEGFIGSDRLPRLYGGFDNLPAPPRKRQGSHEVGSQYRIIISSGIRIPRSAAGWFAGVLVSCSGVILFLRGVQLRATDTECNFVLQVSSARATPTAG